MKRRTEIYVSRSLATIGIVILSLFVLFLILIVSASVYFLIHPGEDTPDEWEGPEHYISVTEVEVEIPLDPNETEQLDMNQVKSSLESDGWYVSNLREFNNWSGIDIRDKEPGTYNRFIGKLINHSNNSKIELSVHILFFSEERSFIATHENLTRISQCCNISLNWSKAWWKVDRRYEPYGSDYYETYQGYPPELIDVIYP